MSDKRGSVSIRSCPPYGDGSDMHCRPQGIQTQCQIEVSCCGNGSRQKSPPISPSCSEVSAANFIHRRNSSSDWRPDIRLLSSRRLQSAAPLAR